MCFQQETGEQVQPSGAAKRFNETFDGIYTASSLMHIPYYAVLGNHDHSGEIYLTLLSLATCIRLYSSIPRRV